MSTPKLIGLEEGLETMQNGITKLLNILDGLPEPNFTPHQHIMLYTTVYNMCTQPPSHYYARELYDMYKETCEKYIISKVLPPLQEKKEDLLLRELLKGWSNYLIMTKRLSKFFCYLERRDIPRYKLPSLEETTFLSFFHLVFEGMNKEILDALFAMFDRKRAGEQIDLTSADNILDVYLELNECTRKNKAKEEKLNRSPNVSSKKINLISSDGVMFEVDFSVALMSKRFEDILETISAGDFGTISVHEVSSKMLTMIIEYCNKHTSRQKGVDLKVWDAQFIDVDTKTLRNLRSSASYLKISSLSDLIWKKVDADGLFKYKTPKEIVQFFCAEDDSNSKLYEEKKE